MKNPLNFLATLLSGNPSDGSLPKEVEQKSVVVDNTEYAEGIVSAEGFGIIASCGGEKLVRPNHFSETGDITFTSLSRREDIHFPKCDHIGPQKFEITVWGGEKRGFELPAKQIKGVLRKTAPVDFPCPRCFFEAVKKSTIRCCLCGGSILPDDPVALYAPTSKGIHERATIVDGAAVGCLRMSCCPSGGFFAGHWSDEGFKPADFAKVCG